MRIGITIIMFTWFQKCRRWRIWLSSSWANVVHSAWRSPKSYTSVPPVKSWCFRIYFQSYRNLASFLSCNDATVFCTFRFQYCGKECQLADRAAHKSWCRKQKWDSRTVLPLPLLSSRIRLKMFSQTKLLFNFNLRCSKQSTCIFYDEQVRCLKCHLFFHSQQ